LGISRAELERAVFECDEARAATVGALPEERMWQAVGERLGVAAEQLPAFQDQFWAGDELDLDLVQMIRGLRKRWRTGLLSNAWPNIRSTLGRLYPDFLDAFDEVVFSAEVKMAKPDAQIYHLMVERMGVRPEEAVFVDDFSANVRGAQRAGLQAVHFTSPAQTWLELRALLGDGLD
jgi:epoxide hydrolase-like predicted phosphatase